MALIRLFVSAVADIVRESQRAAAVASGALLLLLTLMIAATSFPTIEPVLVGVFIGGLHVADFLPFVDMAPYVSIQDGGGNIAFSDTQEASGFLNNALLPFYAWLTVFLVALRWVLRAQPADAGFWSRYVPVMLMAAICLAIFIFAAFTRNDVAGLSFLFLFLVVLTLVTGAWSALISSTLDGWLTRLFPPQPDKDSEAGPA